MKLKDMKTWHDFGKYIYEINIAYSKNGLVLEALLTDSDTFDKITQSLIDFFQPAELPYTTSTFIELNFPNCHWVTLHKGMKSDPPYLLPIKRGF